MKNPQPDSPEYTLTRWKLSPVAIDEQLAARRRATIVLSAIAGTIGTIFLVLFLAFGNPLPALVMNTVLIVPVICWAWFEDYRLHRDVAQTVRNKASGRDR